MILKPENEILSICRKQSRPVPAIGIDLGTTFTSVGYVDKGVVKLIQNREGRDYTPSVVHFGPKKVLVGDAAVKRRMNSSLLTVSNIKRLIGRKHDSAFVQERRWDFKIVPHNERACARVAGKLYTPEEVSSHILKYMKKIAADKLPGEPTDAVITVPANFTNEQREATKVAGKLAGLNVLQIVNEPTAAAIAFNHRNENRHVKKRVLVFDLGGGTFDVSVVEIEGWQTRVLATGGSTKLGGTDFDERIYDEAIFRYLYKGIDVAKEEVPDWELLETCEKEKRALAKLDSVRITNRRYPKGDFDLTYKAFVELCGHYFSETITIAETVLEEASLEKSQIEEILLVGGSTRIRCISEKLSERFPNAKIRKDIDPVFAVAIGASILADHLSKKNSDDASTDDPFISLIDVAPFQVGVRVSGNKCKVLVPRNRPIPFSTYLDLTNAKDNDSVLKLEVLEGNEVEASKNYSLAKVDIEIPPKPAGKNNIKVLGSIDANGILSVTAVVTDTGKEVSIVIKAL